MIGLVCPFSNLIPKRSLQVFYSNETGTTLITVFLFFKIGTTAVLHSNTVSVAIAEPSGEFF